MIAPRPSAPPRFLHAWAAGLAALAWASGAALAQDDDSGLAALSATRQRPLFSPTRRPPPPPPPAGLGNGGILAPTVALPPPKPNLQLSGIILGGGQEVALVKRGGDTRVVSVGVGTPIDGWIVSEIAPRAITLKRGDGLSAVVRLPEPGK